MLSTPDKEKTSRAKESGSRVSKSYSKSRGGKKHTHKKAFTDKEVSPSAHNGLGTTHHHTHPAQKAVLVVRVHACPIYYCRLRDGQHGWVPGISLTWRIGMPLVRPSCVAVPRALPFSPPTPHPFTASSRFPAHTVCTARHHHGYLHKVGSSRGWASCGREPMLGVPRSSEARFERHERGSMFLEHRMGASGTHVACFGGMLTLPIGHKAR